MPSEEAKAMLEARNQRVASARSRIPVELQRQRVSVVDIDLPFWSIVILLVKWSLAAIPAAIILTAVVFLAVLALFVAVTPLSLLP